LDFVVDQNGEELAFANSPGATLRSTIFQSIITVLGLEIKTRDDLAAHIYRQLKGERGMDDAERWQHALYFAMSPQERCRFSLKTARSALPLRRFANKK